MAIPWRLAWWQAPDLIGELVRIPVDVIVTAGPAPALAARQATTTIPIVAVTTDPIRMGWVADPAHPEGNITAISDYSPELSVKRLELLKEVVPGLTVVAVLVDPVVASVDSTVDEIRSAAVGLGVRVEPVEVRTESELEAAFATAKRLQAAGVLLQASTIFSTNRARIAQLALEYRLPAMNGGDRENVAVGALMSYGPARAPQFSRAAVYVDRLLRGAKVRDLPIEKPKTLELVINMRTAQTLGLVIPPAVAGQVTEWLP